MNDYIIGVMDLSEYESDKIQTKDGKDGKDGKDDGCSYEDGGYL